MQNIRFFKRIMYVSVYEIFHCMIKEIFIYYLMGWQMRMNAEYRWNVMCFNYL